MNHYESSGNIALALQAMKEDGVRLINIGRGRVNNPIHCIFTLFNQITCKFAIKFEFYNGVVK